VAHVLACAHEGAGAARAWEGSGCSPHAAAKGSRTWSCRSLPGRCPSLPQRSHNLPERSRGCPGRPERCALLLQRRAPITQTVGSLSISSSRPSRSASHIIISLARTATAARLPLPAGIRLAAGQVGPIGGQPRGARCRHSRYRPGVCGRRKAGTRAMRERVESLLPASLTAAALQVATQAAMLGTALVSDARKDARPAADVSPYGRFLCLGPAGPRARPAPQLLAATARRNRAEAIQSFSGPHRTRAAFCTLPAAPSSPSARILHRALVDCGPEQRAAFLYRHC
jgi:hypothetical protein